MLDAKPFWLVTLMRTVLTAGIAYFVAVFVLLVLIRISHLPSGPLWVPEFTGAFLFIMTVAVCVGLSIPYFMKEWDAGLRTFSMFSSSFLLAMSVFSASGAYDPQAPLQYLTSHVFIPMERKLRV
jgi:hypothetical protein